MMPSAKADQLLMGTVKQDMFLILNSVPITFVTDSELIRPSVSVAAHSLNQKIVAREA